MRRRFHDDGTDRLARGMRPGSEAAKPLTAWHGYRFFFRGAIAEVIAPVQRLNMSLVALEIAVVDWRLDLAAILPRAELATEFAPLSHMLMNGFFFNQGFDIELLCEAVPRPSFGCLGDCA